MARRFPLIRRVAIWSALIATIAVLSIVLWPTQLPDNLTSLSGPRLVRVEHQGQQLGVKELYFPGQLSHSGIPFDATIRAHWTIQVPEDAPPWGLWIERPEYASRTLWDGKLVAETGHFDGTLRSEQPVLAFLPPTTGTTDHALDFELRGAFGRGGVVGRIVHGPLVEINRAAWRVEAQRVALVIILGSLAILQLAIASRRQWRPVNAFFGLFCVCAASYIFLRSDMGATWMNDALLSIRLRRVATAWIGPAAVAFVVTFSRPRLPRWAGAFLATAALASVIALMIPMNYLPVLETALDIGLIVCCVAFMVIVLPISVKHRHGGTLLAAATLVPLVVGVLSEVIVTNGLGTGGSQLFPTLLTFTVGATAAIMVRDIEVSERHHNLVESSVDAIITIDRSGRITDANPAAVTLFQREPVGSPLLDWVMHDDQPIVRAHFMPSEHRSDRAEFRFRGHRDLVVESVGTALERGAMLLVLRDVTRRRKLDQGLLLAARMETVAVLVGGIAHDFNNMLGTLLAHVGFLQMFSGTHPRIKKRLERMETTIERASLLTRRLLALSGGTTAALTTTDLRSVMLSAAELVEPTLSDRVNLHIDIPDELLHIAASPADLEHVLVNLLVNARDAVDRHGDIRFSARPFHTDRGVEGVVCLIEDDGTGVPIDLRA
ncbi:MAG: PAS domain S-box-containing protein, partial [Kiritimatiellia bacterium]